MQDILIKILSMDRAATDMIKKNDKELYELEQKTNNDLEDLKNNAEENAIKEGKALYDNFIERANAEASELSLKAQEICDDIEKKFLIIKDTLIDDIFAEIIDPKTPKSP